MIVEVLRECFLAEQKGRLLRKGEVVDIAWPEGEKLPSYLRLISTTYTPPEKPKQGEVKPPPVKVTPAPNPAQANVAVPGPSGTIAPGQEPPPAFFPPSPAKG